jgi:hypothetical protein
MDIQEKTRVLEESIVITTWYTFVRHPKPFIYIRSLLIDWVMKYLNNGVKTKVSMRSCRTI